MEPTKPCPYCAETIMAAAIKCRYCGERLDHRKAVALSYEIKRLPRLTVALKRPLTAVVYWAAALPFWIFLGFFAFVVGSREMGVETAMIADLVGGTVFGLLASIATAAGPGGLFAVLYPAAQKVGKAGIFLVGWLAVVAPALAVFWIEYLGTMLGAREWQLSHPVLVGAAVAATIVGTFAGRWAAHRPIKRVQSSTPDGAVGVG